MTKSNKKIVVYSTPDCAYCYTLKSYLDKKGFEYQEINIYEDDKEREKMEKISGQKNVPVTVVDEQVVAGWDKKKINDLLGI